jgi:hypothetical protein
MMIIQENKTMSATKDDVNHLRMVGEIQGPFQPQDAKKTAAEMFHKEK